MSNVDIHLLQQQLDRIAAVVEKDGTGRGRRPPPGPPSDGDVTWRASVDSRLAKVDGALEGLKASVDSSRWMTGVVVAFLIGGFAFLGFQLNRVEASVSALPARLSDEFHSLRFEMSSQVSAIANAITATRQAQPAAPQIMLLPSPTIPTTPSNQQP